MLVAPTEPSLLKELGKVSSTPEKYGADFLDHSPMFGSVGVQRKEVQDLVASVHDGRLNKEVGQMQQLGLAVLLIEGRIQWTNDGSAMGRFGSWTRSQHLGVMWGAQLRGLWIASTDSLTETSAWLSTFTKWTRKQRHGSLGTRPGANGGSVWGKADNREWGIHLLQSFPGIGPETAGAIYDYFKGVPLQWTVGALDLMEVKGVGEKRADQLIASVAGKEWSVDE